MRRTWSRGIWVALQLLVGSQACTWFEPNDEVIVKGTVVDLTGQPITQGELQLGSFTSSLDDQGNFRFKTKKAAYKPVLLLQSKVANYEPVFRRIPPQTTAPIELQLTLWPIDKQVTFTMPSEQEPPVELKHEVKTTKLSLQIPPNSLVIADSNQPVTGGEVRMSLTLWEASEPEERFPALLNAVRPGGNSGELPIRLVTSGMMSIRLFQQDRPLQIAAGQTIGIDFRQPVFLQQYNKTQVGNLGFIAPTLWTLNETTGLWEENSGDSTFDVDTGTLTGRLRHLSIVNVDEPVTSGGDPGSCVRGRVLNNCRRPIVGARVTGRMLTWQSNTDIWQVEGGQFQPIDVTTNADGEYYINLSRTGHMHYLLQATAVFAGVTRTTSHQRYVSELSRAGMISYNTLQQYRNNSNPDYTFVRDMAIYAPEYLPSMGITCSNTSGTCPSVGVDGRPINSNACDCYARRNASDPCLDQVRSTSGAPGLVGINDCWWNPLSNPGCFGPSPDTRVLDLPQVFSLGASDPWFQARGNLCGQCWPLLDLVFTDCATSCQPKQEGDICDPSMIDDCCNTSLDCYDRLCLPRG